MARGTSDEKSSVLSTEKDTVVHGAKEGGCRESTKGGATKGGDHSELKWLKPASFTHNELIDGEWCKGMAVPENCAVPSSHGQGRGSQARCQGKTGCDQCSLHQIE